jgi:hypothetical protein
MSKPRTHFEQVPLSEIEQILQAAEVESDRKHPRAAANVSVKSPVSKTGPYSVRNTG